MPTNADVELYKSFQKSPILFIEKMWGLVPQPVKPEYKEKVAGLLTKNWDDWEETKKEFRQYWFCDFQKGKHTTWQQWILFLSIEKALKGEAFKRIAIESGQGLGKTSGLAMIILWFLFCFKDSRVPCTAPTVEQMYDALWREVYLWLDKMPTPIKGLYEWTADQVRIKERPQTWFARARTARKERPEALAGIHGEHMLVVCDEASGIDDEIFRVAEGILTGENVIFIMFSQHQRLVGYFHRAFTSEKQYYQRMSFSSIESPIVNAEFVNRIDKAYGKDSDPWRVQVLGLAPKEDAVDNKGYVPLLNDSDIRIGPDCAFVGMPRMGVDPSGEGDDTTEWIVRDRFKAKCRASEKVSNAMTIAAKSLALMDLDRVDANEVFVDNFGEGANVGMEMARAQKFVKPVNVGDQAEDTSRYLNLRAEAYWRCREWLRKGGELVGPGAEALKAELLNIRYRYALKGKIQIMGKEEMRKNSIKSPNKADAFMLTFVEPDHLSIPSVTYTEQSEDPYSVF